MFFYVANSVILSNTFGENNTTIDSITFPDFTWKSRVYKRGNKWETKSNAMMLRGVEKNTGVFV